MGQCTVFILFLCILMFGDYDFFGEAILSQSHREIDTAESISVSIKVIITCTKEFSSIMKSWGFL